MQIPGRRQQKLLAILLLNANQAVAVERLEDELWERPPRSARQQVHNAVGGLRSTLAASIGASMIAHLNGGYVIEVPESSIDARLFLERTAAASQARTEGRLTDAAALLEQALDLWRGDALSGLDGREIDAAALKLNEHRLTANEDLLATRVELGDAASAAADLRTLVALHPLRESLRAVLMRALHASGRQADALAVYAEGRDLLREELGIDPGPELRRLHAALLKGTVVPPAPPAPQQPASSSPPAPPAPPRSYLPHDTSDFSGRTTELDSLSSAAQGVLPTALVVSAIDGMGGVGKTAIAVHLAHRLADQYPDGQYFIDLHGFTPGTDPLTSEQALDALLRDSGVPPELIPATLERRSALWRSHMSGARALLVIDNAVDAAHVRPLLPASPGTLVLITSRRRLTALEGALPFSLDVLPVDDAVTMFVRIAGEHRTTGEQTAVRDAVELCGRLPLAIRIAAARLRDRRSWQVSNLVRRLRDQTQRGRLLQVDDRDVMAVLRLSYRYLPPERRRLFRLLSVYPGADFDAYAAAALTGYPVDAAEQLLEELLDDNLVMERSPGRFHLHDLVRDCAHQIMEETDDEAERDAALVRLLDYQVLAAHEWGRRLGNRIYRRAPVVDSADSAVRAAGSAAESAVLLQRELGNLVAAAVFCARTGRHRHTWQLACFLQPALKLRNYGDGSFTIFEQGLAAARHAGDPHGEAACLQGLALVSHERRSTGEAREYLTRALELSRMLGDREAETTQLLDLGSLHLSEDRLKEALNAFLAAEALAAGGPDSGLQAAIDNNLGVIYRDIGRYDSALHHLRRAVRTDAPDRLPYAKLLTAWSIGTIHHARGDHAEALREFERIKQESEAHDYRHSEAAALLGLSTVHRSLGAFEVSLDLGRRALALAKELDLPKLECEVLNAIGETTFAAGDLDHAERVFEQAADYARRRRLKRYEARAAEGFAHIAAARGRWADAERHWKRASHLYPPGMVDLDYVQHHLDGLADRDTTCFRCAISLADWCPQP
ncbi:AfsR/SARP family transcriptional regulator [Saccharothrix luteola]|uniref:AfsR/SARP family transcriptional regulator n=1 Tax=Saccharothrix luteola TaxID=2893018 RepID=UPI001E2EE497|nr:BTAD domain-containing putative transcriptional regulator [Saccharothrix luteola]MCC8251528.1 tetratricopeptide repeat protein [Saccharothrix luteola]